MATFSVEIPDAQVERVTGALAAQGGYQAQVPDPENPGQMIDNPQTQDEFAKQFVATWIIGLVAQHEGDLAAQEARQTAVEDVKQNVVIS